MTEPAPRIVVTIAAPVDVVWRALRDREELHQWHGWEGEGIGDEIDLIYFREATEVEPGRVLRLGGDDVIELTPDGEGTRVQLTRAPHSDDSDWAAYYDDITEGWTTFLHQLKFAVEVHAGEARRTLFYSGLAPARPEPGELAEGTAWFESDHQSAIRVPAWGDGLLVTAHIPASGAAMAVITTYGLDDSALASLDEACQAWWSGVTSG